MMNNNGKPMHKTSQNFLKNELLRLQSRTTALLIVVITVMGVLFGYYIFSDLLSGPFRHVGYAAIRPSELAVEVKTRFPARTRVEYGTFPHYVNSVSINNTFEVDHSVQLKGLLPNKDHTFRLVAEDKFGKTYHSNFYTVK